MKHVFTQVTVKTLKKNRMRTLVTIIGIILATSMLTAVTTFASSLQQFMINSAIEAEGDWHGAQFGVPGELAEKIASAPEVEHSASYQEVGYARIPDAEVGGNKQYLFVTGFEEELFDILPVRVKAGRLPENAQEIALPSHFLTEQKNGIKLGDTLTLELGKRFMGEEQLGNSSPVSWVRTDGEELTSEDWGNPSNIRMDEELRDLETRTYTVVGMIDRPAYEDYSWAGYDALTLADEEPAQDASFSCYYKMKKAADVYYFSNQYGEGYGGTFHTDLLRYEGSSDSRPIMQMFYGLATILIVLIMTGSISLVYNSFSISVADRTKQFGLLASVGATPRQLRAMVRKEALLVSAVGIPLGLLAGIAGIGVTLSVTGDSFFYLYSGETPMQLHVSWAAVVIAVLTALLTVLISAWIPARRAAKVNPIEAIRQTKDIRVGKRVTKKGKLSQKLFGLGGLLAAKQFARNKRQYRTTVFSLFISIVLFISASSFSAYLRSSFETANKAPEYDVSVHIYGEPSEYERVIEKVGSLETVDRVYRFWELPGAALVSGENLQEEYRENFVQQETERGRLENPNEELSVSARVLVLSDEDYLQYLQEQGLSAEEYANAKEIRVPVINQLKEYSSSEEKLRIYEILTEETGEVRLKLNNYAEDSEAVVQLEIGSRVEKAPLDIYAGWRGGLCFLLSESMCQELIAPVGGSISDYQQSQSLFLKAGNHQQATDSIEQLALTQGWKSDVRVQDVAQTQQNEKNLLLTADIFTYGFIVLISLIAAANVFNTISTGFLLRKKEFAVLASVGMGTKAMNRMVNYECLLYGCKSLLYGLPVSVLVTWWIYRVVEGGMDMKFFIPLNSILTAIFSVFLVVFISMRYAMSKMKKENVIDSIRQESV